jgi:DNA ligase D-like protein (predicted ligase)
MQKMPARLFFVAPMECKTVESVPDSDEWQYELKLDGYRAIATKQFGEVDLYSRNGNSFNARFPEILDALTSLPVKSFVVDGEIVALDEQGRHSFELLQRKQTTKAPLRMYLFDLLHLNGVDLKPKPLSERHSELESHFHKLPDVLQLSPILAGSLETVMSNVRQFEFEGVVAKERESKYLPGARPGTWQKQKTKRSDDFIVGGYIQGPHGVDELVVGKRDGKRLKYVASVRNGFVPTTRRQVFDVVKKLKSDPCPFVNLPEKKAKHAMDREKMKEVHWIKPKLIAEIAFNEITRNGHLRHSKFLRLRDSFDLRKSR